MPPSVKLTLPVGEAPVTVAVNVTLAPEADGFEELASVVVVADLTTCERAALADPKFPASPLYVATMLRVPAASVDEAHAAMRTLPLPVTTTAPQPVSVVPPLVKMTVPVGEMPVTV